jgi:RNA polymerase sigma-54 factor
MPSQGLHQVQRLGLQQTLSPQLQQSLHILQIPALELSALIRQELTSNPVLEETPPEDEASDEAPDSPDTLPEEKDETKEDQEFDAEIEALTHLDQEWRDYFNQTNPPVQANPEADKQRQAFLESISRPETVQEHLMAQLHVAEVNESQRQICETIIGNIDDRGFLVSTPEELAAMDNGKPGSAETCLKIIQSFDPIGAGARNLAECLMLQLHRLGYEDDSLPGKIVRLYLNDLAEKKHAEIAQSLGCTIQDIHKASSLISTLDPQPGSRFGQDDNRYITPDLVVQKVGDDWVVISNDDWIPSVRISNTYKDILGQTNEKADVKSYVRERLRAAKFLIKSIQQRQQTIMKIAYEILRIQLDFFNEGKEFLKPLTMTEVAQKIGVHETTVSRAIANKYMQTPHGIFELKYFFTPGIRTSDGGLITQDKVKAAIAELVGSESADKPLTDQDIMAILKEKNIPIARRTVAKYREEMHILPSHQRKSKG